MRAREFTINVPITIKINGDNEPEIETGTENDDSEIQQNPVMVTPLQQELELKKAELGKTSPVIDKLTANQFIGKEPSSQIDIIDRIKALISK